MHEQHPSDATRIVVLLQPSEPQPSVEQLSQIKRAVREKLLLTTQHRYSEVKVEIRRRPDGTPASLIATLLRSDVYKSELMRINVDADFHATTVEPVTDFPY